MSCTKVIDISDNILPVIAVPENISDEYDNNSTWYTPIESWKVKINTQNGLEEYAFSTKKRMICNFQ